MFLKFDAIDRSWALSWQTHVLHRASPIVKRNISTKLSRNRIQERGRSQLIRKVFELPCSLDGVQNAVERTVELAWPNDWGADAPSPAVEHEQPQKVVLEGSGKKERSRRPGQQVKQRKRCAIGQLVLANHQVELSSRCPTAGALIRGRAFAPQPLVV